jgi:hypothetical protein
MESAVFSLWPVNGVIAITLSLSLMQRHSHRFKTGDLWRETQKEPEDPVHLGENFQAANVITSLLERKSRCAGIIIIISYSAAAER